MQLGVGGYLMVFFWSFLPCLPTHSACPVCEHQTSAAEYSVDQMICVVTVTEGFMQSEQRDDVILNIYRIINKSNQIKINHLKIDTVF